MCWLLSYEIIKPCQQLRLCWFSQAFSIALMTVIPQLCRLRICVLAFFIFPSSFISISDLKHQQRTPCCSHLTWSTSRFKEWAHQGQGALPMHSSLPRAYLILVGYLTDGRQEDKDGCLYVKDNTGIIPCEVCPWPEGFCSITPYGAVLQNATGFRWFARVCTEKSNTTL